VDTGRDQGVFILWNEIHRYEGRWGDQRTRPACSGLQVRQKQKGVRRIKPGKVFSNDGIENWVFIDRRPRRDEEKITKEEDRLERKKTEMPSGGRKGAGKAKKAIGTDTRRMNRRKRSGDVLIMRGERWNMEKSRKGRSSCSWKGDEDADRRTGGRVQGRF